jgi:hypothetical protein
VCDFDPTASSGSHVAAFASRFPPGLPHAVDIRERRPQDALPSDWDRAQMLFCAIELLVGERTSHRLADGEGLRFEAVSSDCSFQRPTFPVVHRGKVRNHGALLEDRRRSRDPSA